MKPPLWFSLGLIGAAFAFAGCGEPATEPAGLEHEEHPGETDEVSFKEGRGLQLPPEVVRALALKTIEAEERPVAADLRLTAHVFATVPHILASVQMPEAQATALAQASFAGARLLRVDRTPLASTGLVDFLFELDPNPSLKVGDFAPLTLSTPPRTALAVPRSAVLDGATGTFVYVVNGEAYLRTPVQVGLQGADYVEIADGLYAGDVVVATSVDQLWLAELRLTKGGGHCH